MFSHIFPAYICDSDTLEKRNTDLSILCMHINVHVLISDVKEKNVPNSPAHWEKGRFSECESEQMRRKEVFEQ